MIGHIQKQLAEALLTCIHHGQTAKPDTKYTHKDKDKDKDTDLGSVTVQNRKKSQRTDHVIAKGCWDENEEREGNNEEELFGKEIS